MNNFINHPIFLCGHRKTGTTMLLGLLDDHPELLVYPAEKIGMSFEDVLNYVDKFLEKGLIEKIST